MSAESVETRRRAIRKLRVRADQQRKRRQAPPIGVDELVDYVRNSDALVFSPVDVMDEALRLLVRRDVEAVLDEDEEPDDEALDDGDVTS
jgi:hypothetical protein